MKKVAKLLFEGLLTIYMGLSLCKASVFDNHLTEVAKANCLNDTIPSQQGEIRELDEKQKKWIYKHIKYPKQAIEEGIQGNVVVEFVIEADGSVGGAKVVRSDHQLLNEEAVRVISSMPKFKPILENGTPTRKTFRTLVPFRVSH